MFARRSYAFCSLLLMAATLVGCKPTVVDSNGEASIPGAVPAAAAMDSDDGTGLAELLIDPGDLEIVNLHARERATTKETASGSDRTLDRHDEATSGDGPIEDRPSIGKGLTNGQAGRTDPLTTPEDLTGMRQLHGRFVTIVTDLPSEAAVNELALAFDRAVEQLARYFGISLAARDKFSMTGYVMRSKERFQQQGLLPSDLPPFLHGYQRGNKFWVYDQPSDYYRRHLVLHEGTHGFMEQMLGGTGPPWYREGMADYLATHSWKNNKIELGYMPKNRNEVPYWGRIKLLKEAFAQGRALMIQEVMRFETREYENVDAYAWSWAAAMFLDSHPMFKTRFRALRKVTDVNTIRFTRNFEQQVINELRELDESWQVFIANMEYGYDFERFAIARRPGRRLPNSGAMVTVQADRGWQSTGYRVERGKNYSLRASGQCIVQADPEEWTAEPNGITLRYYKGEPLGRLLGNVRFDQARDGLANLAIPLPIGLKRLVQPEGSGTLYLRINDSPANLADNEGEFTVQIIPR